MADESMVIVNFPALENAIQSFTQSASRISELASSLKTNASAIQTAVVSEASNIYVGKINTLSGNFSRAEERLTTEVNTLKNYAEREREAESQAENLANSVSTFSMD